MPSSQPYYTQDGYSINGRNLTITSSNPDDPAVVASTIIQQQVGAEGSVNPAFLFQNVGPLMRLWGITIRGFSVRGLNGFDGLQQGNPSYDGEPGDSGAGMAILCESNASPTVKNCVIDDCHSIGGDGGNGAAGVGSDTNTTQINGGNGGWPGGAYGGAVLCENNSNPAFINCTFSNNSATGGNGGDGGNGNTTPSGQGGRGGGWYYGYNLPRPWYFELPLGEEPRFYSGLGGAVCIFPSCTVTFESCTFINNISSGGLNGICGQTPPPNLRDEPTTAYRIDNLGGAVYLLPSATADFNNCTFTANTADTNKTPASFDGFLGYGGAVAADYGATSTFSNCSFSNNTSDVGGGVYLVQSYSEVNDCNFFGNTASHGGGLLFSDSVAYVASSTFSGNVGIISGSDGGAIGLLGSNAEVVDCNISNNQVGGSGGGIYMSSKNIDGNEIEGDNYVLVKNCLITGNTADLDGGGISANWYSEPNIVNCTIFNNRASDLGGGLFGSYGSYIDITNSIIWNNVSPQGSQIAVDSSSFAKIGFSDVGKPVTVESELVDPNNSPVIRAGFDSNTLAANDDDSTGPINIGFTLNFFGNQYSSLFVNNNGNITFDVNLWKYTPFGLTTNIGTSIIAPFFADVDTRVGNLTAYGPNTIDGHAAFGATWNNVGYFSEHTDKLNSFQILLIDRDDRAPGDFDIEFNYQHILWETGDASGGVNGFGGSSAHAGFSNGTGVAGTYYEFNGSGVPGALLDSNPITGLIHNSRDSAIPGRYIFEVHGGVPTLLGGEPFYEESNSIDGFVWRTDSNSWEPNSDSNNISDRPVFRN